MVSNRPSETQTQSDPLEPRGIHWLESFRNAHGSSGLQGLPTLGLVLRWQASMRRQLVDHLRQHAGEFTEQLVPRQSRLLLKLINHLWSECRVQLIGGDR